MFRTSKWRREFAGIQKISRLHTSPACTSWPPVLPFIYLRMCICNCNCIHTSPACKSLPPALPFFFIMLTGGPAGFWAAWVVLCFYLSVSGDSVYTMSFCAYFSHLAFWNVNVFLVWEWATVERKEGPKRSLEIGCTLSLVGHSCNGTTSQSGFLGLWGSFLAFMAGEWHFEEDIIKYLINTTNSMPCMIIDVTMLRCKAIRCLQITRMRTSWLVWAVDR